MAKRVILRKGDVFEVRLGESLKYFQYLMDDETQLGGNVIRVFSKLYRAGESIDTNDIIKGEVECYSHTFIRLGVKEDAWRKVGNSQDLGECCEIKFKSVIDYPRSWNIWTVNQPLHNSILLPDSYENANIGNIFPVHAMLKIIENGEQWLHYKFRTIDY